MFFEHKYLADSTYAYNTNTLVGDNQRVGRIPDLIGSAHMAYSGDNTAPLTDSYPKYFKPFTDRDGKPAVDKEGYIFFDNVANKKFSTTSKLSTVLKGKRELWLVMRRPAKAGSYDAYLDAWKSGFFADKGQERIGLSGDASAVSLTGQVPIPLHVKTLVRIKLDGANSEVFINNVRVTGPLAGGYFPEGNNAEWENLVLGTGSNSAYWDWYASYYKQGNFTSLEAQEVYTALASRHKIGTEPGLPYASNIRIVKSGDTYALDYTFNNPLGYPEDKTRTEYQFIYGGRGNVVNVQQAYYIPAMANLKTFNRKDYAFGNTLGNPELFSFMGPYAWFRITVKVYDTQGNSWRFQTAEWTIDNDYPYSVLPEASFFNHKFVADQANAYDTNTLVGDNQRVGRIPDLIGSAHMAYTGDNTAPLTDSYPKYFRPVVYKDGMPVSEKEGYIFFDNVANKKFTTSKLSTVLKGKRELWLVMRRPAKAGSYDAYLDAWKSGFFADKGQERIGLSGDASAVSLTGQVPIPLHVKTLVRIKLDGANSEVFINNKRVTGPLAGGYFPEGNNAEWENLVLGAESNSAYWDWYASYYKAGNFTSHEAADAYYALSVRHSIGTEPGLPYASNIRIVKSGDTYALDYTFNNPLGYPEDKTRTEYQFIYGGRGNVADVQQAYYIPAMANLPSFNRKDYSVGNTLGNPELFSGINQYAWFRMTIKVYDTQGNSWRFQSAEWTIDNDYPFTGFPDAQYFHHKFLADQAFSYTTNTLVGDNQRVGRIPDLIGSAHMEYTGDNVAPISDSYPKYFRPLVYVEGKPVMEKEGYVFIDNVANEKFTSINKLSPAMTGKRELWLVMRRPGLAANHEAYLNAWNAGYFSDRSQGRVGLSNAGLDAISPTGEMPIPFNEKTLVRIKLDGLKSEIFINNKRVTGPLTGGYFSEGNNGIWEYLAIGATTNNAYWDWYASYYKRGNFSPLQAQDVYTALASRHEIGSLPPLPYASNIRVARNGDNYYVDYTFNNPLGYPEDKNRTEFQFIYGERGPGPNIFGAYDIPAMANKKLISRKDYAVGNTLGNPELFSSLTQNAWLRMTVKVYDTKGNSWRFQSAQWIIDNEYPFTSFPDAQYFDHKYQADKAYSYQTNNLVQDGQRAGRIPDLIGNAHMEYSGDNETPINGSFPTYFKPFTDREGKPAVDKEGYIFFDNVFHEKFSTSNILSPAMTGKRELWLVMRRPAKAGNYDAYLDAWKSGFFTDKGQERIGLSGDESAVSLTGQVSIPLHVKTLVRIKLDGANSEAFINNVRVTGPLPGGYFPEGNNAEWENLVLGAESISGYWDWYASYYKQGNFTSLEAQDVYTALASRHKIGTEPGLPYASNIRIVKSDDTYMLDYTFKNPLGYPEDKTRTEYQFIYGDKGNGAQVKDATVVPALANRQFINRRDYAIGNSLGNPAYFSPFYPYAWFRMTVKVYDTMGNSWRFQSAQWMVDNDYMMDALPVSLTRFEAREQAGQAFLFWQTATETNHLGFEVQGSANGLAFEKLGFVNALQGNSTQINSYSFLDPAFSRRKDPIYYYRLKQVGLDGTAEHSKIVALQKVPGKALVQPIPFNKDFSISLESLKPGHTEVSLIDITGKVVHRQTFPVHTGVNHVTVQPQAWLPKGMFVVQFETAGKVVRIKTLKN